ncbi:hypothetical protein AABB24_030854 [Solanum stoloniferum]|uniref:Retrotransposon Copia-like N-terminal domain-containing protein n=1 Tax=Solanum stoloniferum TaxID=62892 RepID=A0ABD2RR40_9SOLN
MVSEQVILVIWYIRVAFHCNRVTKKTTMTTTRINQNDPLYIGPSGVALIPIKITCPENYGIWSRLMQIYLLGKRKYGFVTGACSRFLYQDELHEPDIHNNCGTQNN